MTVQNINLVLPLAQKATAMRIMETTGSHQNVSSAITLPIIKNFQQSDVDSKILRSTPQTQTMPGIRTSTMETRTTGTRIIKSERELSADQSNKSHAYLSESKPSFYELVQAYIDCRKHKRNTQSALAFELNLERNLTTLYDELISDTYSPGKSICFVITRPKPREVWAADFRDRIVHHLFYNRVSPRFYASFIADSCACIPERGTLYAAKRLESKIRSASENWSKPCFYLKMDLANFFVAIDKNILFEQLNKKITDAWWLKLAEIIVFHDPRSNYVLKGNTKTLYLVPAHKRLANQASHLGLPIGNLSSQFFANVYLNDLDQFIKHQLHAKYYIRYVDDFIILNQSAAWLNAAKSQIESYLPTHLNAQLNPKKTILQPIARGVDFVGQVIKPWHRSTRKRTVNEAITQIKNASKSEIFEKANSYFGLIGQASKSHHDCTKLANVLHKHGYTINQAITKTYRNFERETI